MFKNNLYKVLVLGFYCMGDIVCRINTEWAGNLYQKMMSLSLYWDEKLNFWWWKEPPLNKKKIYENFKQT
jgi:hypothetical protein